MAEDHKKTALSGAVEVIAEGFWPHLSVARLDRKDELLFATGVDPQIDVGFESPVSVAALAISLPSGYEGDAFLVYYSQATPAAYAEACSQPIKIKEGLTLVLLRFDSRVYHLRLDPMEKAGGTGIANVSLCVGRDEETLRAWLDAQSEQTGATVSAIDVVVDPEKRDVLSAFGTRALQSKARARSRLSVPRPVTPHGRVDVVFDPKPHFLDPDAPLLREDVLRIARELFGVDARIRTDSLGELGDADLTFCVAQTALSATMEREPWDLPTDLDELKSLCFMSVGSATLGMPGDYGFSPTRRARAFLRLLFAGPYLHGVRDAYTAELLEASGISNFEIVGTPSLWELPDDLGSQLPLESGERVLFAADEYYHDVPNDVATLRRLAAHYKEVALWPRNLPEPLDYAKRLIRDASIEKRATLLAPGAASLLSYLAKEGCDYVGPNLEAGIKALAAHRRTLILTGDDRSSGVVALAHLPAMRRIEVADALDDWLARPQEVHLTLPKAAVARWKAQFVSASRRGS